jgi:hypothetical protein
LIYCTPRALACNTAPIPQTVLFRTIRFDPIISKIPLDVSPNRSDHCDDRKLQAVKEKLNMSTFTIDAENNIVTHAELPAGADESQSFSSAKELAKLAAERPGSRLVDTWNSFAGVAPFDDLKPVKKFTSRKAAVTRIWRAIGRLSPDSAQPAADVAAAKGKSKKSPPKAGRRAPAQKGATEAASNKKAEVIAMMKRAKGATLAEITEWEPLPPRVVVLDQRS